MGAGASVDYDGPSGHLDTEEYLNGYTYGLHHDPETRFYRGRNFDQPELDEHRFRQDTSTSLGFQIQNRAQDQGERTMAGLICSDPREKKPVLDIVPKERYEQWRKEKIKRVSRKKINAVSHYAEYFRPKPFLPSVQPVNGEPPRQMKPYVEKPKMSSDIWGQASRNVTNPERYALKSVVPEILGTIVLNPEISENHTIDSDCQLTSSERYVPPTVEPQRHLLEDVNPEQHVVKVIDDEGQRIGRPVDDTKYVVPDRNPNDNSDVKQDDSATDSTLNNSVAITLESCSSVSSSRSTVRPTRSTPGTAQTTSRQPESTHHPARERRNSVQSADRSTQSAPNTARHVPTTVRICNAVQKVVLIPKSTKSKSSPTSVKARPKGPKTSFNTYRDNNNNVEPTTRNGNKSRGKSAKSQPSDVDREKQKQQFENRQDPEQKRDSGRTDPEHKNEISVPEPDVGDVQTETIVLHEHVRDLSGSPVSRLPELFPEPSDSVLESRESSVVLQPPARYQRELPLISTESGQKSPVLIQQSRDPVPLSRDHIQLPTDSIQAGESAEPVRDPEVKSPDHTKSPIRTPSGVRKNSRNVSEKRERRSNFVDRRMLRNGRRTTKLPVTSREPLSPRMPPIPEVISPRDSEANRSHDHSQPVGGERPDDAPTGQRRLKNPAIASHDQKYNWFNFGDSKPQDDVTEPPPGVSKSRSDITMPRIDVTKLQHYGVTSPRGPATNDSDGADGDVTRRLKMFEPEAVVSRRVTPRQKPVILVRRSKNREVKVTSPNTGQQHGSFKGKRFQRSFPVLAI